MVDIANGRGFIISMGPSDGQHFFFFFDSSIYYTGHGGRPW